MAERRDDGNPLVPDLEIPDLAPAPRPAPQPARSAPAPRQPRPAAPAAPASPQDYFGSGSFDEDHFDVGGGAPLPLDDSAAPGGGSALDYFGAATFDDDDFDLDGRIDVGVDAGGLAAAPQLAGAPADQEKWPSGTSPDPQSLMLDPLEIELLADYGKPPTAIYLAPLYSLRVFQRGRTLKPVLQQISARLAETERRRDQLLAEIVQANLAAIEASERLQVLLEPVRKIDALAGERQAALAATNAEYARQVGAADEQIKAIQAEQTQLEAVAVERAKLLAEREELFKRADVRQKRVYIELRSAREVAAQVTPAGGAPPAEHAARMAQLEQQAAAMQPDVDRLRQDLDAARAEHDAVRARITQATRGIRQLQTQRQALADQFQKQLDVRHQGVSSAVAERDQALADAGRAVLATRAIPLPAPDLERVRQVDAEVEALVKDNTRHLRALDAFDADTYKRGLNAVMALAAVVVLLTILAIVL